MKRLIKISVVVVVLLSTGCAHWEAAFTPRDYSCKEKVIQWNSMSRQYEQMDNYLCFDESIKTMKHSKHD